MTVYIKYGVFNTPKSYVTPAYLWVWHDSSTWVMTHNKCDVTQSYVRRYSFANELRHIYECDMTPPQVSWPTQMWHDSIISSKSVVTHLRMSMCQSWHIYIYIRIVWRISYLNESRSVTWLLIDVFLRDSLTHLDTKYVSKWVTKCDVTLLRMSMANECASMANEFMWLMCLCGWWVYVANEFMWLMSICG